MNIRVAGASRFEQNIREAPASLTIICQDEIKKYGYRTLAGILRSVPGFFVTNDHNYQYLGVRGFNRPGDYNTRILLLVDGHRLNDRIYDQAPIGTDFPVDVDLINRVEIIRGPGSSLSGSNAFLAVINVITRNGRELNANGHKGFEVSGDAGSFNSYKGRLTFGKQWSAGSELLVSGSYYDSRGPNFIFDQPDNPLSRDHVARNCDYDRFQSAFSKFAFQDFTLTGVYHSREKEIPTGAFGTLFGDPRNRTIDTRAFLDLKYEHTFASAWQLQARISYDHYPYDGFYFYDRGDPLGTFAVVENRDMGRADWWGGEVQVSKTFLERHKVILGSEYRDYFRLDQRNFDQDPKQVYLDDRRDAKVWAIFAQDEFRILKNLRINAGLRFDHYSTFGGSLNLRVALIYSPFRPTTFKPPLRPGISGSQYLRTLLQ